MLHTKKVRFWEDNWVGNDTFCTYKLDMKTEKKWHNDTAAAHLDPAGWIKLLCIQLVKGWPHIYVIPHFHVEPVRYIVTYTPTPKEMDPKKSSILK